MSDPVTVFHEMYFELWSRNQVVIAVYGLSYTSGEEWVFYSSEAVYYTTENIPINSSNVSVKDSSKIVGNFTGYLFRREYPYQGLPKTTMVRDRSEVSFRMSQANVNTFGEGFPCCHWDPESCRYTNEDTPVGHTFKLNPSKYRLFSSGKS
jgi:hypothetical protein